MVSALVLAALFFKLGVEQRVREVGLLRAVGFGPAQVRRQFLGEGLLLAVAGGVLGVARRAGVCGGHHVRVADVVGGCRRHDVADAARHARRRWLRARLAESSPRSRASGGRCVSLARISERSLLAGEIARADDGAAGVNTRRYGIVAATVALAVHRRRAARAPAAPDGLPAKARSSVRAPRCSSRRCVCSHGDCGGTARARSTGSGWQPVSRLGFRYARYRPGRSVLSMAVIASATFILISVDAFRRGEGLADAGPHSGVGGYSVFVETLLPIVGDVNSRAARDAMNLFDLDPAISFEPFRLLPGDDASCLNLYEPKNPRILAPTDAFLAKGRFAFQAARATTRCRTRESLAAADSRRKRTARSRSSATRTR